MQISASIISSVTNILLSVLVVAIVGFTKPETRSRASKTIFITIFLATLVNSTIIPLILNAQIFGVRPNTFLSFISFIKINQVQVFDDFSERWFAYISPYYVNMFLVSIILPWIDLLKVSVLAKVKLFRLRGK
jgi:hypothetical protein